MTKIQLVSELTSSAVTSVLTVTPPHAKTVVVLLHGRGGVAEPFLVWMQSVMSHAWLIAPQAVFNSWYPYQFMVPQAENQPQLDDSLQMLTDVLSYIHSCGYDYQNIILAGFSQGACLASEYIKRHPRQYGAVVLMSGGLIGTDAEVQSALVTDLAHLPIYIGCDENDPHIPWDRVEQTTSYFLSCNATVDCKRYSAFGHQIHPDAIAFLKRYVKE